MLKDLIILVFIVAGLPAACTRNPRVSLEDSLICKNFYQLAVNMMSDLGKDSFEVDDLTFDELSRLTPRDPSWRKAHFLALRTPWSRSTEDNLIVIESAQSRILGEQFVHRVCYNSGRTDLISSEEVGKLSLKDYVVLPHIRN